MKYRADIDGLRTLAVMPVILFHAGASWLPGGFVGVDIFFVISGYLISLIIIREVHTGSFSFLRFYERRLRRIIPALLVVLATTVVMFQMIALPDQAMAVSESAVAALLSLSNFYFWQKSGYFAPTAEFMPLLHTWSLAVEEQFYLVFPPMVLAIWKLRLPLKAVIAVGTVAAFAASVWLSFYKPSVAYYLLPARAWELALGAVLAVGLIPQVKGRALQELVPAFGVGLILASILWIREDMAFPGWVALLPCLGAAMVIHAGGQSWIARRILSSRAFVLTGLLSYSLYLWHWPILVAFRINTANSHLPLGLAFAAILVSFIVAFLSWRFVEQPFRNRTKVPTKMMIGGLGATSAAIILLSAIILIASGFPQRLPASSFWAMAAAHDIDPRREACFLMADLDRCRFGTTNASVKLAIIGDSHAAAIRPAFQNSALLNGGAGMMYWAGGCAFLEGAWTSSGHLRFQCDEFRKRVWSILEAEPELETVVIAGRWPVQFTGLLPESGSSYRNYLMDSETLVPSEAESKAAFVRSITRTVDKLLKLGVKVVLVGAAPEPGYDVPATIALARYHAINDPSGPTVDETRKRIEEVEGALQKIATERSRVKFVSVWRNFCLSDQCTIEIDGKPLYSDDDHLSVAGAMFVAPSLARELASSGWR